MLHLDIPIRYLGTNITQDFSTTVEVYSQYTNFLLAILTLSLCIAFFGILMNKWNQFHKRKKAHKKYVEESIVFMNRKNHHLVGYNGGTYDIYIKFANHMIISSKKNNFFLHMKSVAGYEYAEQLKKIDTLLDKKTITSTEYFTLKMILYRVTKQVQKNSAILKKLSVVKGSSFVEAFSKINLLLLEGNLLEIEKVFLSALQDMHESGEYSFDEEVFLRKVVAKGFFLSCDFKNAEKHYLIAREMQQKQYGSKNNIFIEIQHEYGYMLYLLGRYKESLQCQKSALVAALRSLQKNHPNIGVAYNAVGIVHLARNAPEKAIPYFDKALGILQVALLPEHPSVGATHINLALGWQKMFNYGLANRHFMKGLQIKTDTFGHSHLSIALIYELLGNFYSEIQKYEQAFSYFNKSFDVILDTLGEEHPILARLHISIGDVFFYSKKYDEAINHYKMALSLKLNTYGEDSLDIVPVYNKIGDVLKITALYGDAITFYTKALHVCMNNTDSTSDQIISAHVNLAGALREKEDYDLALSTYRKARSLNVDEHGEKHVMTANCYSGIGKTYCQMGEIKRAEEYHRKALEISNVFTGEDMVELAKIYFNYGETLIKMHNYLEAKSYLEKSREIFGKDYRNHSIRIEKIDEFLKSME